MLNFINKILEEKDIPDFVADILIRMNCRIASADNLIKNLREPKAVRRCLALDNKRYIKQIITGRRVAYSEVQ